MMLICSRFAWLSALVRIPIGVSMRVSIALSMGVSIGAALLPLSPAIAAPVVRPSQPPRFQPPSRSVAPKNWLALERGVAPTVTRSLTLWATYYYVHRAQPIANGYPLLDLADNPLGPALSERDWCYAALQGTVLVADRNSPVTYNFAGRGDRPQVNCAPYFSSLSEATLQKVNRVRFTAATAPYGYGTGGFRLVPYRTVAVDRTRIPIGSVLYIPAARGQIVTLPTGEQITHDGYFFAADVGSAIKGNHIDVFVGTAERNPFPFVKSRAGETFQAYLVQDPAIAQTLTALHRR